MEIKFVGHACVRVYVTKSVSVDSIRNDIDAKKTNNKDSKECHIKRKETKNQQEAGERENENEKSQTDRLQQNYKKRKICNDEDAGE